ncbi:hypothetical protein T492DRAFT_842836 [Pavlovales sp. CCMP2436]|nr:hypothetical protein T492DRAFT_842836 [Pavlovales sp. CCMP2436]
MSSVFGALKPTATDLSFSSGTISLDPPPVSPYSKVKTLLSFSAGPVELVFPLDSEIFTEHEALKYEAKAELPGDLSSCICVIGDLQKLEDEAITDPKQSTYTINQLVPTGVTARRVFSCSTLENPLLIVERWRAEMSAVVADPDAGNVYSFGHAGLSFDIPMGKIQTFFIPNLDFGNYEGVVGNGSVVDARNRIAVELAITGSQRTNTRRIRYDIVRFLDEQYNQYPPDPAQKFTLLIDGNANFSFFAGGIQVVKDLNEDGDSTAIYGQIYKPGLRICGGVLVAGAYQGSISPISTLAILSNSAENLTVDDFNSKRLPLIYGRSENGTEVDIIDLLAKEVVNILFAFRISPGTQYSGGQTAPLQWAISGSNSGGSFTTIESFGVTTWQANTPVEFAMSVAHVPYKFWRITISRVSTNGNSIHVTLPDITFISGWSIGMTSLLSVHPVSVNTFIIMLGDSRGEVVSMIETPVDWQFTLLLLKNGQIVNAGLYNFSHTSGVTKLS